MSSSGEGEVITDISVRLALLRAFQRAEPASEVGSGKPHDPEKERLSEIIEALNDVFGTEVNDEDQQQFLTGIAQRISGRKS